MSHRGAGRCGGRRPLRIAEGISLQLGVEDQAVHPENRVAGSHARRLSATARNHVVDVSRIIGAQKELGHRQAVGIEAVEPPRLVADRHLGNPVVVDVDEYRARPDRLRSSEIVPDEHRPAGQQNSGVAPGEDAPVRRADHDVGNAVPGQVSERRRGVDVLLELDPLRPAGHHRAIRAKEVDPPVGGTCVPLGDFEGSVWYDCFEPGSAKNPSPPTSVALRKKRLGHQ